MIRFSAALVAVAIGLLAGGCAASKLLFIYIAIAVAAVALIALLVGVVLRREEIFGERQGLVPAGAGASPVIPARVGGSRGSGKSKDKAGYGAAFGEASPVAATRAEPIIPAPPQATPSAEEPWYAQAPDAAESAETGAGEVSGNGASADEPGGTVPPGSAFPADALPVVPRPASGAPVQVDDAVPTDGVDLRAEADVSEAAAEVESSDADAPDSVWRDPVSGTTLVAVIRGVPRYHKPGCVLIWFMPEADLQKLTVPGAQAAGCTPCTVCQSEK